MWVSLWNPAKAVDHPRVTQEIHHECIYDAQASTVGAQSAARSTCAASQRQSSDLLTAERKVSEVEVVGRHVHLDMLCLCKMNQRDDSNHSMGKDFST